MERDSFRKFVRLHKIYFNSRAHVERDVKRNIINLRGTDFNSRAHVERDVHEAARMCRAFDISTHALTWSATSTCWDINISLMTFQLTRSRGARPADCWCEKRFNNISTHALTWSATRPSKNAFVFSSDISTHALTWSATLRSTRHGFINIT